MAVMASAITIRKLQSHGVGKFGSGGVLISRPCRILWGGTCGKALEPRGAIWGSG